MSAAKPLPEIEAEFAFVGEQRRGVRRARDRRAPRMRIEPLFAATLISHVTPPEARIVQGYAAAGLRTGLVVNLRA